MADEPVTELQDETIWPQSRIDAAKVELAAEEKRRVEAAEVRRVAEDPEGARKREEHRINHMDAGEFRRYSEDLMRRADSAQREEDAQRNAEHRAAQRSQGAR